MGFVIQVDQKNIFLADFSLRNRIGYDRRFAEVPIRPMKNTKNPLLSFFAILAVSCALCAGQTAEAPPQIVGKIADGAPPPPASPKPDPTANCRVLRESVRHENGRTVTIQRIEPPPPAPPKTAPLPPDLSDPQVRARLAAERAEAEKIISREIVPLSITVYDHALSLVRWVWLDPQTGEAHPYVAWVADDLSLLEGVPQIEWGPESARHRSGLLLGIGCTSSARASRNPALAAQLPDLAAVRAAFEQRAAPGEPAPKEPRPLAGQGSPASRRAPSPAAPAAQPPSDSGISAFQNFSVSAFPNLLLVEGDESNAEATAPLRALTVLLVRERPRLEAARAAREKARRQREADLKAHPPKKKDITIRYWEK